MNRIRELRLERKLTMKETAGLLNIPYTTYVNYEKGYREPSSETLIAFADFFNCTVDYLIGKSPQRAEDSVPLVNGDAELTEYLEALKSRPEHRMLFHVTKGATKEQIEAIVQMIEAMNGGGRD